MPDLVVEEAVDLESTEAAPAGFSLGYGGTSGSTLIYTVVLPKSDQVVFLMDQEAITTGQAEFPAGELVELTLIPSGTFQISEVNITGEVSQDSCESEFDGSSLSFVMPEENVAVDIIGAALPLETVESGTAAEGSGPEIAVSAGYEDGSVETEMTEPQPVPGDADKVTTEAEPVEAGTETDTAAQPDDVGGGDTEAAEPNAIGEPETLQEQDILVIEEESEGMAVPSGFDGLLGATDGTYKEETANPRLMR